MRSRTLALLGAAAMTAVTTVAVIEAGARFEASRQRLRSRQRGGSTAVVVLGYGNPEPEINATNRHRVDLALAGLTELPADVTLVVCGGPVASDVPEAVHLERYAREVRGFTGPIIREEVSRTTWQNIREAIPLIAHADRILIASTRRHAGLARLDLRLQRPDLARRLIRLDAPRPFEAIQVLALALGALVKNARRR